MGAGHAHALFVHEHSRIHKLAPEAKLIASLGFVVAVALTPRQQVWAFGIYSLMLAASIVVAHIRFRFVIVRLIAILPFVLFAFLIPFIATGETVSVLGMNVSEEGLWSAFNVIAKATLGAGASIILTATTEVADILKGLRILRVPALITAIAMFMIRYLELISDEYMRMRTAMTARGYNPRWLWEARPIASSAGALFVRTYERGERVHAAMLSRGFSGTIPDLGRKAANRNDWLAVAAWCLAVAVVAVGAGLGAY
jgi:cobalt/nickel transport system permease protein